MFWDGETDRTEAVCPLCCGDLRQARDECTWGCDYCGQEYVADGQAYGCGLPYDVPGVTHSNCYPD